jgi:hypothetical protein
VYPGPGYILGPGTSGCRIYPAIGISEASVYRACKKSTSTQDRRGRHGRFLAKSWPPFGSNIDAFRYTWGVPSGPGCAGQLGGPEARAYPGRWATRVSGIPGTQVYQVAVYTRQFVCPRPRHTKHAKSAPRRGFLEMESCPPRRALRRGPPLAPTSPERPQSLPIGGGCLEEVPRGECLEEAASRSLPRGACLEELASRSLPR